MDLTQQLQHELFSRQDSTYQTFNARLLPNLAAECIIGVRTPQLRALAKQFQRDPSLPAFLSALPHTYFEENQLHAFFIETIRDYDEAMRQTKAFLPYVDNWATCDCFRPKVFLKHPDEVLSHIQCWLTSSRTYTVRYGVGLLLSNYLDSNFSPEQLSLVAAIRSEEYYVNMMVAWYFATALAKQEEAALPYFQTDCLPEWTRKKAIQKALESYRIGEARKRWLRELRSSLK